MLKNVAIIWLLSVAIRRLLCRDNMDLRRDALTLNIMAVTAHTFFWKKSIVGWQVHNNKLNWLFKLKITRKLQDYKTRAQGYTFKIQRLNGYSSNFIAIIKKDLRKHL